MSADTSASAPSAPPPTATVLLVDDDPLVLAALRRTLARMDLRLFETTDPTKALALVAAEHVDILVTDVDMPVLNGMELLAQVRGTHPHVVRLLLTGAATLGSAIEAINKGEVFRYLTKPWEADDLRNAISEALGRMRDLRARAASDAVAERRTKLLAELEEAYPGVTSVTPGDHVIDQAALADALAAFDSPELRELWAGEESR